MHNKFTIIDRGEENEEMLFGSLNYTVLQEKYDPSFIFQTKDRELIEAFKEENDLLKKGIHGYKKFRKSYKPLSKEIQYNNGFVEVWFGPGFKENSIKTRLLELIDSAKESIDILTWRVTDPDVASAILKKAYEGVKIRIITDDYYIWSPQSVFLIMISTIRDRSLQNIEIMSDVYRTLNLKNEIQTGFPYFNSFIHHHTLIIDNKITLSGTNNWTYNGFFKNDESTLVSDVDFWVKSFKDSFTRNYEILRKNKLDFLFNNNILTLRTIPTSYLNNEIVIYNEISEKEVIPEICFRDIIKDSNQIFLIPNTCNKQAVIFIFDRDKNALASNYLYE